MAGRGLLFRIAVALTVLMWLVPFALWLEPVAFADRFNTETSSDGRAFGMGNAVINTSRGPGSVFYNPANISLKNTPTNLQLVNFQLDSNEVSFHHLMNGEVLNPFSLSKLYSRLSSDPGSFSGFRTSIYPNFTYRFLSIGFLYERNEGALVRPTDGALRVKVRDRAAPVAAVSSRLFGGILRLGGAVQLISRGDADYIVQRPSTVTDLSFKKYTSGGAGISWSSGATLTFPFRYLPSFSVVARDIGGTRYVRQSPISFGDIIDLPAQPMTLDAAMSTMLYFGRRFELKTELNYRDITNQLHGSRAQHFSFGTELVAFDMMRFRFGINHGYLAYGFGVGTKRATLEIATYGDEIETRFRGQEDRRYVVQYSWNLFR